MLKLLTDVRPGNPTIGLRWCIDKEDKAALKDREMAHLFVLIVVLYQNRCGEDRQLVPLSQLITYVGFRYPGTHKVFARLVYPQKGQLHNMENYFLERVSRYQYNREIVTYEQDDLRLAGYEAYGVAGDELEVEMPKEYFAKEPVPWLKRWANMWHKYPHADECEFKKRVLLAFSLKWIAVLAFFLVRTSLGLLWFITAAFLGGRRMSIKPLLHPWASRILHDIWPKHDIGRRKYGRDSWIVSDKEGNTRLWTILVSPPLYASLGLILFYIHWRFGIGYREMLSLAIEKLRLVLSWMMQHGPAMLVMLVVFYIIISLADLVIKKMVARKNNPSHQAKIKAAQETDQQEILRLLSCNREIGSPDAVSLKGIPRKRRTIRLRYLSAKRERCRMFAG